MIKVLKGGFRAWHPSPFFLSRPDGCPNYILLIVRSQSKFHIDGHDFDVSAGYAVVFTPNTGYFYGNTDTEYIDDWLHFSIEGCPKLQKQLLAMCNQPFPIENRELFTFCIQQVLLENSYGQNPHAQENIEILFTLIFNHLTDSFLHRKDPRSTRSLKYQLKLLRLNLENSVSETYSTKEYARRLNISESYFQYLYKETFKISFRKDIIRMRIEHVKMLLTTSDLPLDMIAEKCGYSNEVHFYRQFKKMTGMSPSKFRKLLPESE